MHTGVLICASKNSGPKIYRGSYEIKVGRYIAGYVKDEPIYLLGYSGPNAPGIEGVDVPGELLSFDIPNGVPGVEYDMSRVNLSDTVGSSFVLPLTADCITRAVAISDSGRRHEFPFGSSSGTTLDNEFIGKTLHVQVAFAVDPLPEFTGHFTVTHKHVGHVGGGTSWLDNIDIYGGGDLSGGDWSNFGDIGGWGTSPCVDIDGHQHELIGIAGWHAADGAGGETSGSSCTLRYKPPADSGMRMPIAVLDGVGIYEVYNSSDYLSAIGYSVRPSVSLYEALKKRSASTCRCALLPPFSFDFF